MNQPQINPYSLAMLNCLAKFETKPKELDPKDAQFLANMIQGRFLQFLVNRLCRQYGIESKELEKKLSMIFMQLLTDKFFVVFREKVKAKPEMVYEIAYHIVKVEKSSKVNDKRVDWLFLMISKRFFEYQNFQVIIDWIESNPEVEKLVFLAQIEQLINDAPLLKAMDYILSQDREGMVPLVFKRYLSKSKIARVKDLVASGDWRIEAEFVHREQAHRIAWQNYIDRISQMGA